MNRRYKIWTPQERILDKFTVLEEPKEEVKHHVFSNFYSINPPLEWVHAIYKTWLKMGKYIIKKKALNNSNLKIRWIWYEISSSRIGKIAINWYGVRKSISH